MHEKNKAKKVVAQAETNVNEKADKTEAEKVPMKAESKLSQLTDKDFNGTGVWRLEDVLPNGEKVFIYICKSDYRTLAATAVKPKEDKSDK